MFYRLQVIINDIKSLGEKVKDEDFYTNSWCVCPRDSRHWELSSLEVDWRMSLQIRCLVIWWPRTNTIVKVKRLWRRKTRRRVWHSRPASHPQE
jgi:hypothetical protein